MAEKRMISKPIIDSDAFLDMPPTSQNLYFHLNIRADDEGFIDSPKKIMRIVSCTQNDLDILLSKKYLLGFKSGVLVIKHWRQHNSIRKDRIKETLYLEEKSQLFSKKNGAYTFTPQLEEKSSPSDVVEGLGENVTDGCQSADKSLHSIDKYSLEESSLVENRVVTIQDFVSDSKFIKLWVEFLMVRKEKGAINSKNTEERLLEKLLLMSKSNINYASAIVEKSITNGWKDLFEIKGYKIPKKIVPVKKKEEEKISEEERKENLDKLKNLTSKLGSKKV